jgi:hypothetical protein
MEQALQDTLSLCWHLRYKYHQVLDRHLKKLNPRRHPFQQTG